MDRLVDRLALAAFQLRKASDRPANRRSTIRKLMGVAGIGTAVASSVLAPESVGAACSTGSCCIQGQAEDARCRYINRRTGCRIVKIYPGYCRRNCGPETFGACREERVTNERCNAC